MTNFRFIVFTSQISNIIIYKLRKKRGRTRMFFTPASHMLACLHQSWKSSLPLVAASMMKWCWKILWQTRKPRQKDGSCFFEELLHLLWPCVCGVWREVYPVQFHPNPTPTQPPPPPFKPSFVWCSRVLALLLSSQVFYVLYVNYYSGLWLTTKCSALLFTII